MGPSDVLEIVREAIIVTLKMGAPVSPGLQPFLTKFLRKIFYST